MTQTTEIALEMTIQTGQVYTCPAENLITAADHAYYIRERTWPKPIRLALDFTGPANYSPYQTETITLDPNRPAEALARDILRRLPPARAREYYAKAQAHKNQREAERAAQRATVERLREAYSLTTYESNDTSAKMHRHGFRPLYNVEIYQGQIEHVKLNSITLDQFNQIMEILK